MRPSRFIVVLAPVLFTAGPGCDRPSIDGEAVVTDLDALDGDAGQPKELEEWIRPEEGEITSFTCDTKLGGFRDPCLEGGCCGFPQGGDGECWENASCGYGTIQSDADDEAVGAVCSCSWCDRYRVSCTADYETGAVECTCSVTD